jgi:leucyl-tRNA synthetase
MRVQTEKLSAADADGDGGGRGSPCGFSAVAAQLAQSHPGSPVFLLAATLRPETMYGQTNCWALPTGEYGIYEGASSSFPAAAAAAASGGDGDNGDGSNGAPPPPPSSSSPSPPPLYVVGKHAARNMAYQDLLACGPDPDPSPVRTVTGQELLGVPLSAPRAPHATVFVLPLLTISMTKGTGVVTSVPSDSPDDFAALRDLKQKPALRAKYGVKDEWLVFFDFFSRGYSHGENLNKTKNLAHFFPSLFFFFRKK